MNLKKNLMLAPVLLAMGISTGFAQQDDKPLSNSDVVRMLQAGFSDDLVLAAIQANRSQFDVSVDALLALKQAGADENVIKGVLAADEKNKRIASAPSTPRISMGNAPPPGQGLGAIPPEVKALLAQMGMTGMGGPTGAGGAPASSAGPMPRVTMAVDGQKREIAVASAQIATSSLKGDSGAKTLEHLATEALRFGSASASMMPGAAMAQSMVGGRMVARPRQITMTYVWALPGRNSQTVCPSVSPKFEISYADIPGIDPDAYEPVLVRLVQTNDNWRLVGASEMDMATAFAGWTKSISEERVSARLQKLGRGDAQLEPEKPLPPGEYGIVLHPVHNKRPEGSLGGMAANRLFYSVWDFGVNGGAEQPTAPK
ncbi:MAG TPA: hypothetical protein VN176_07415 [Verrucomicrobiae bacterium]|jgi:hypothetical protein|nr:hypothetical protein [Verrucomicrobiae bacterium]